MNKGVHLSKENATLQHAGKEVQRKEGRDII